MTEQQGVQRSLREMLNVSRLPCFALSHYSTRSECRSGVTTGKASAWGDVCRTGPVGGGMEQLLIGGTFAGTREDNAVRACHALSFVQSAIAARDIRATSPGRERRDRRKSSIVSGCGG